MSGGSWAFVYPFGPLDVSTAKEESMGMGIM